MSSPHALSESDYGRRAVSHRAIPQHSAKIAALADVAPADVIYAAVRTIVDAAPAIPEQVKREIRTIISSADAAA